MNYFVHFKLHLKFFEIVTKTYLQVNYSKLGIQILSRTKKNTNIVHYFEKMTGKIEHEMIMKLITQMKDMKTKTQIIQVT